MEEFDFDEPKMDENNTKPILTKKDEKLIGKTLKSVNKLYLSLETLDFEMTKFNKFEQKISSFKIKNTMIMGAVGLVMGACIGSFGQSKLNNYYIKNEAKKEVGDGLNTLKLLKKYGIKVAQDQKIVQMYVKKSAKVTANDGVTWVTLEIKK